MNKNQGILMLLTVISLSVVSCMKPRVELNESAWGDNATITAAVLFRYTEITNQVGYNEPATGYQTVAVATRTNTIDKAAAMVNLVAVKGVDLTRIGIRFSHFAKQILPMNGAPAAGVIADFSKGRHTYRLISADGTTRDWTVSVSVEP